MTAAAHRFLQGQARQPLRVRCLPEPSPFAAAWLEVGEEAAHLRVQEVS